MSLTAAWPALNYARPTGFSLLLRQPVDVVVLRAASWWTAPRLLAALGAMISVLVLVLSWVLMLRRTVARQASKLAAEQSAKTEAEVEFKATLRERNRLAADLHDTIEQGLTAVALQLEAARTLRDTAPGEALRRADFAYDLLDRSRDDVRRSVWSLRLGIIEGRSLGDALRELAHRTERAYGIACHSAWQEDGVRVPEFEANQLLLVAQEAITNALKHGQAKTIAIAGKTQPEGIQLTIADDGQGFDPDQAPGLRDGHFGINGMRERLRRINGSLTLHSSPGRGTRVEAVLPLNGRADTSPAPCPPARSTGSPRT
jgi:signal transduction histidine kinase